MGEKNEIYPLRVLGDARHEGTNAVYKVELMGGVVSGMPYDELTVGKRFSVEYSPVEKEMSRGVGDVRYSSPVAMRNEWSTIRIKHKVPGSMLNKKLAVGIPFIDAGGKKMVQNMWMHHVDFKVEETFGGEKNNVLMYGRSNRNANGENMKKKYEDQRYKGMIVPGTVPTNPGDIINYYNAKTNKAIYGT